MNKEELIRTVSPEANTSLENTRKVLDAFVEVVTETVSNGDFVRISGFGTFGVKQRSQRTGRNPKSGEQVIIKARKVPWFSPGQKLKNAVTGPKD